MDLYAVCLNTARPDMPDDFWVEFYWAEDQDHAEEQAENAHQGCAVVCVARTPREYVIDPELGQQPPFEVAS
jgi:hypothetical protein